MEAKTFNPTPEMLSVLHKEYFEYLDNLRRTGVTNMYGAATYLERDFKLDRKKAKEVLAAWMKQFNERKE